MVYDLQYAMNIKCKKFLYRQHDTRRRYKNKKKNLYYIKYTTFMKENESGVFLLII